MRTLIHAVADPEARSGFVREGLDKFWKEVVCEGDFRHPANPNVVVSVDLPRMQRWVDKFAKMREAGVPAPVACYGHAGRWKPQEHAGHAEKLEIRRREDGRFGLWARFDVPRAEDASRIGTSVKGCSIGIDHDYTTADGEGGLVKWGEVLDHVALTNDPVVFGTAPFEPISVEVPADAAVAAGLDRGTKEAVSARVTGLSREPEALSRNPWGRVDKSRLPASAHLLAADPDDRSTWRLPVHEGTGTLVDAPGGRGKLFASRGPANAEAILAAAERLSSDEAGISAADRAAAAKRLAGLMSRHAMKIPAGVFRAAGLSLDFLDSMSADQIPTLAELIGDAQVREAAWRALNAFDEVVHRVNGSDLSPGEKRARILAAIDDFRDVFSAATKDQLEAVRRELPAALGLSGEVRTEKQADDGPAPEDDEMKIADLKNLKPLAAKLGVEIKDDATPAQIDELLGKAAAGAGAQLGIESPETPREKSMREELERMKAGERVGQVKRAAAAVKTLLDRGSITRPQAERLEKLLTARPAKVARLSKDGSGAEVLHEEDADLATILLEFAHEIPAGAVTGRKVTLDPRPGDDAGDEGKDRKKNVAVMLEMAGFDPATGEPKR